MYVVVPMQSLEKCDAKCRYKPPFVKAYSVVLLLLKYFHRLDYLLKCHRCVTYVYGSHYNMYVFFQHSSRYWDLHVESL